MKKIIGIAALLVALSTQGKSDEINFEIQNKAAKTIWIGLTNGDQVMIGKLGVKPVSTFGERPGVNLDLNQKTRLFVWLNEPKTPSYGKTFFSGKAEVSPKPDFVYEFTPGKTIFLTWDKENFARPQTGVFKGLLGYTESGLPLKNNVKANNIDLRLKK